MSSNSLGSLRDLIAPRVVALLLVVSGSPALAQPTSSPQAQPPVPVHLPDLTSYDCGAVTTAPTADVRHLGQTIRNVYHEWQEIYFSVNSQPRLGCISLLKPEAKQLSVTEARTFLTHSAAIGVLDGVPTGTPPSSPVEPANVKPQPLLRRSDPPAGTSPRNTPPVLPPVPATKLADPDGSNTAPPAAPVPSVPAPHAAALDDTAVPATVGVEDRTLVANTKSYPWNTIGFLVVTYPNNESFRCSATLISPYVVLTAGHCVHNNTNGGYVTAVYFYPGQYQVTLGDNSPQRPYGGQTDFEALQTTQEWTQISGQDSYPVTDYGVDIAAIEFKTPFTYTSTFMPVLYSSTAGPVTNAGYPGVFNNVSAYGMYEEAGAEEVDSSLRDANVRQFDIDASGGDSGSPFFYVDPNTGQSAVVGSLSYGGDDQSGGPWYDSWSQALLSSWVSWTPSSAASAPVSGVHFAGVFSTAQLTSQSYLRFYNSSSSAGTVAVTLENPDSGATLATWTSPTIAAGAEEQFFIQAIESGASQQFTKPPFYSVTIQPTFSGYVQHVLWQLADNSLTNLTTCDTGALTDPMTLMAVHSSLLAQGYPSTVVIANAGSTAVNVSLGIYDARNGNRLATYTTGTLQPNAQKITSMAAMEAAASPSIAPSAGMYHYVIKADTSFTGFLQNVVNNTADAVVTDMTAVCKLAPSS